MYKCINAIECSNETIIGESEEKEDSSLRKKFIRTIVIFEQFNDIDLYILYMIFILIITIDLIILNIIKQNKFKFFFKIIKNII